MVLMASPQLETLLELWFFRDLTDEQRYKLGVLCGLPGEAWPSSQLQQKTFLRHVLSALAPPVTTPAESGGWQWRDDLDAVPRDRKFLVKYSSGDVTIGGYLDNSQTRWPWQGVRPYESGRAERIGDSIVAWMEMPSANLSGGSVPVASPNGEHLRPLADREKSAALVYHEEPAGDTQGALPVVGDAQWVMVPREPTAEMLHAGAVAAAEVPPLRNRDQAADVYRAMIAAPAALVSPPDNGEAALLAMMAKNLGWELSWGPREVSDEEGEYGWRVHERRGNRSDLEWTLIGFGAAPIDALRQAALQSHNEGSAGP